MSSSITSPARPASCRGPTDLPARRGEEGSAPLSHPHRGVRPGRRLCDRGGDNLGQVDTVGNGHRAGLADRRDIGTDAREPEGTGVVAVAVVTYEIPAAPVGNDTPRLDGACSERRSAGRPVRNCTACRESMAANGIPRTSSDHATPLRPPKRRWTPGLLYRRGRRPLRPRGA